MATAGLDVGLAFLDYIDQPIIADSSRCLVVDPSGFLNAHNNFCLELLHHMLTLTAYDVTASYLYAYLFSTIITIIGGVAGSSDRPHLLTGDGEAPEGGVGRKIVFTPENHIS